MTKPIDDHEPIAPNDAPQTPDMPKPWSFQLFSEMALMSLLTFLACMLLVPWVAGVAAGSAHLRRHLFGLTDSVGTYVALLWDALRGSWLLGVASLGVLGMLVFNVGMISAGVVPGGQWGSIAMGLVAAVFWTVVVRAAGLWSNREGEARRIGVREWFALLNDAARRCTEDLLGTLVIIGALVLTVAAASFFPPISILLPGLWVLAVVVADVWRTMRASRA